MIRDPLYRQILDGLEERIDPDAFERAIPGLLPPFLGLAIPVPGGGDAGFDAAVVDGEGEPYPVVCTTGTRVLENLRRNLSSNLAASFRRRRAVVATTQQLSAQRKTNLYEEARRLGFELMAILDREPLAQLLYHRPEVRRSLLGLGGAPPALAAVPAPGRYPVRPRLLARDDDLDWLRSTTGDRIVVGVPGAGKTALAATLVEDGEALFVRTSATVVEILDACRERRPATLILDDAHAHLGLLGNLRTGRRDTGVSFAVVATTWPRQLAEVAEALGVDPRCAARTLELLPRDEILSLYRELEVQGPDAYMRELVDQAANRPGLAVTLAVLWRQGAWEEIVRGQALRSFVSRTLRDFVGREEIELVAALALGGKKGVSLAVVSESLGLSPAEARRVVVSLDAAGILSERGSSAFAVEPAQLRSAVLADVFFSGRADRLDYRPLLDRVESRAAATDAIMQCLLRGGRLGQDEARAILVSAGNAAAWSDYARLGRDEALWVLDAYRDDPASIAGALLDSAPDAALTRLLEDSHPVPESLGSASGHPLRVIRDWVRHFTPGQAGAETAAQQLAKRGAVADALVLYAEAGGPSDVVGPALGSVLDPALETVSSDPGRGNTITITTGVAPAHLVEQLKPLWHRMRPVVAALDRNLWLGLREMLWALVQPMAPPNGEVPESTRNATRALAAEIVRDLHPIAEPRPGIARALAGFARELEVPCDVRRDPVYDVLFPEDPVNEPDYRQWASARAEDARRLAAELEDDEPLTVAERLAWCRREAAAADDSWPDSCPVLAHELARRVEAPEAWLEALDRTGIAGELGADFLTAIVRDRRAGWQELFSDALDGKTLTGAAIRLALTEPGMDTATRRTAIRQADEFTTLIERCAMLGEIPTAVLGMVLTDATPEVALAAAVGHWVDEPRGEIDPAVAEAWRKAIVSTRSGGHTEKSASRSVSFWLGEILGSDPDLARQWLRAEIEAASAFRFTFVHRMDLALHAAGALTHEQRAELLASSPLGEHSDGLVRLLVGDDTALYTVLLERQDLQPLHITPLRQRPDGSWWSLAVVALEAGISPSEVALAAFALERGGWRGSEAALWQECAEGFASPPETCEPRVAEVARIGRGEAARRIADATRRERHEAMRGIG